MTSQEPDPRTEAVAGLGRQLEALERAVADLSQLQPEVMRHARIIEQIARRLATADEEGKGGAATWLGFNGDTDTDTAEAILSQLVAWVRDIYLRYSDAVKGLPSCWIWHCDIVEELLVLRDMWVMAYGSHARPTDRSDWHDRMRPGVVRRIKIYGGACSIEDHRAGECRSEPAPVVIFTDAVPAVAAWWATGRTRPGPAPTEDQLIREKINTNSRR
jgi:hypothetical protein